MAQTGYTPIQLYHSTTSSNTPTAGNLAPGELAINTADGKLFYEDSGGVVQVIATKAGADGDVVGPGSATSGNVVTFNGTTGKIVQDGGKALPSGSIVGTSDTQTLTSKTLTDPSIIGTILEDVYTITDGAAFEVDPSNGSIQLITLGASRTPKATNFAAGEAITLMVDDGSAYTITWTDATWGGSGVVWMTNSGSAPTLNTTGYTTIVLWRVSTQVYGAKVG